MIKITQAAVLMAIVGVLTVPTAASASVLVNTGTPTGSGAPLILSSAQSLAAEFSASAANTTIESLSAYLTAGTAQAGDAFTFDIYQTLPTTSNRSPQPLFSLSTNWEQAGWTTATVDWTLPGTGDYWLVLKNTSSGRNSYQFDAPQLTSSSAGPVPALAFETAPTDGFFAATTASFGVEVFSTPEPASAVLALVGTAFLARWRRRITVRRVS
jgi:hypothetical protein